MGECFLLSTYYVNWSTSLVGDPLYHPDLNQTIVDKQAPKATRKEDIRVELYPAMDQYCGMVSVPVAFTADNPEVALLQVDYHAVGRHDRHSSLCPVIFQTTQRDPFVH